MPVDMSVLSEQYAVNLCHIFQESFSNIDKYANAKTVTLLVSISDDTLTLDIADDRDGFDLETAELGRRYGLLNIKDWAERLGGMLLIESAVGQGTRLKVLVPMGYQATRPWPSDASNNLAEGEQMPSDTPTKVLMVDDHEIVRKGLVMLISRQEDLVVAGEAGAAAEAVQKARELSPDVVVLDIRMPDGSEVEACRDIRAENPDVKVLMLTSYSDEEAVMGSIMAGASGYLLKEIRSEEIVDAIKRVGAGQSLLDPMVTASVLDRIRNGNDADDGWNQLTSQEQRILESIAEGKTKRGIAHEIHLSDKRVKNYVSNILGKLEVSRWPQAAAYLVERHARREFS